MGTKMERAPASAGPVCPEVVTRSLSKKCSRKWRSSSKPGPWVSRSHSLMIRPLLLAQRHHGIDAHRPARRQIAGEQRQPGEQQWGANQKDGLRATHAGYGEKHARERADSGPRERQ